MGLGNRYNYWISPDGERIDCPPWKGWTSPHVQKAEEMGKTEMEMEQIYVRVTDTDSWNPPRIQKIGRITELQRQAIRKIFQKVFDDIISENCEETFDEYSQEFYWKCCESSLNKL